MGGCFLSFFLSLFVVPSDICVMYLINLLFPLTVVSSALPPALLFLPVTGAGTESALRSFHSYIPLSSFPCFPGFEALKWRLPLGRARQ